MPILSESMYLTMIFEKIHFARMNVRGNLFDVK